MRPCLLLPSLLLLLLLLDPRHASEREQLFSAHSSLVLLSLTAGILGGRTAGGC